MNRIPVENEVLADKYRIERVVGRGGMGIVLAAWHLALDQRVALKCLQPELAENSESAARFLREARAAAKIKSEHGVRVLDVGNFDDGVPYLVMEFLDGRDLADELRDRGPLPVEECMTYALQAIEAVAEAHSLGIVHRDLKPENLFLARVPDGTRIVKVLDFGISKSMVIASADNRSLTQSSTIMGSPLYMSPEQMRAPRTVDARTDIWSLGAIMYELLTGHPPYVADTLPQLCAKMLESDPTPLRAFRPDADVDLERIVTRCLARNVTDRWQSMGDLAHALLPFASRSARVNVERVARVLNSADYGARMAPMTLPSGTPQARGTPPRQSELEPLAQQGRVRTPGSNPQHASMQGDNALVQGLPIMPVTDTQNRASWENGSRQQTSSAHPPSTGKVVWWIAGAAMVLVVGAFVWSTRKSEPAPIVQPVLPSPVEVAPAPAHPAVEAVPAAAAPAPTTPTPASSAAVEAAGNAAASAAPEDTSKARAEQARPEVPAAQQPAPIRRSAPPAPAPSPTAPGKGLTDFGGRR